MSKHHWIANNICSNCWKSVKGYAIQQGYIFCPFCGERLECEKEPAKHKELDEVRVWIRQHEVCPNGVIGFDWSGSPGCGRYELIADKEEKLHAMSEYMDKEDDKNFLKIILDKVIEDIIVDE